MTARRTQITMENIANKIITAKRHEAESLSKAIDNRIIGSRGAIRTSIKIRISKTIRIKINSQILTEAVNSAMNR